jgi:chloramphenicol-sensitive protein RarD
MALSLSISFALYGLIRKLVKIGSAEGLFIETTVIAIPVLIAWPFITGNPLMILSDMGLGKALLLSLSGILTGGPLILFAYAAKNLKFTTLGFTQYLSPSLKFLCGILIFKEVLLPHNMVGFALIWTALALYSFESLHNSQRTRLMNRKNL